MGKILVQYALPFCFAALLSSVAYPLGWYIISFGSFTSIMKLIATFICLISVAAGVLIFLFDKYLVNNIKFRAQVNIITINAFAAMFEEVVRHYSVDLGLLNSEYLGKIQPMDFQELENFLATANCSRVKVPSILMQHFFQNMHEVNTQGEEGAPEKQTLERKAIKENLNFIEETVF